MPDLKLKAAAEEIAKKAPDYAGRSAFPPSAWWVSGDQLFVIGADGRKFAGALPPAATLKITMRPPSTSPEKASKDPAQSQPPAKHKAGK